MTEMRCINEPIDQEVAPLTGRASDGQKQRFTPSAAT